LTAISAVSSGSLTTAASRSPYSSTDNNNNNDKLLPSNSPQNELISKDSESNNEVSSSNTNLKVDINQEEKESNILESLTSSKSPLEEINSTSSSINEINSELKLKVPPLKIICANPNGGLPYVKPIDDEKNIPSTSTSPTNSTTKQNIKNNDSDEAQVSTTIEPPITRNKSSKTNRVASPITTQPIRTTPTRRSTAAAAAAAAAAASTTNTTNTTTTSTTTTNTPITTETTIIDRISPTFNPIQIETTNNEVIKRKLRSHTRHITSDPSPSPSPLTIINENQNNEQNSEQTNESHKLNDQSNDSTMDVDSNCTTVIEPINSRKRRNRQNNIQQSQNENNDSSSALLSTQNESTQSTIMTNSPNGSSQNSAINLDSTTVTNTIMPATNNSANQSLDTSSSSESNKEQVVNCIKRFVDIRQEIAKKRDSLMQKHNSDLRIPKNFQDFLIRKRTYLIKSNKDLKQSIPYVSIFRH
jgi:hypothetical protein